MYVPVLKNISTEMDALEQLSRIPLSSKTCPLIEIVQLSNSHIAQKDLKIELKSFLDSRKLDRMFFVDILRRKPNDSSREKIQDFLNAVNSNNTLALDLLMSLKNINRVVPVIPYDDKIYSKSQLKRESSILRTCYSTIAFRAIYNPNNFDTVLSEIFQNIKRNDFLILDIKSSKPQILQPFLSILKSEKAKIQFKLIVIKSTLPSSIVYSQLTDGKPIHAINNSLLKSYKSFGFDGFGDYACIKHTLPGKGGGGTPSPIGIFYAKSTNEFICFRRHRDNKEFKAYIAPSIINSSYWNQYNKKHHATCPGCLEILDVHRMDDYGQNSTTWKKIKIMHYIKAVDEILNTP